MSKIAIPCTFHDYEGRGGGYMFSENKKVPERDASTVAQRGSAGKARHTHHQAPERGASTVTQCGSAGNKRMDPIAYAM